MGYNVVDINSTKILWEDFYKLLIIGFDNEIKKKLNLQKEKNFNNINLLNDLKEKNLITTINEVDIIDLEKYNMPPYIIANKNKINKNLNHCKYCEFNKLCNSEAINYEILEEDIYGS